MGAAGNSPPDPLRAFPAPTNLKVLPKDMTGQQVHDVMVRWSAELGVECRACHTGDPGIVVTGGPSHDRFAEDSKAMKQAARIMYIMTEEINRNHIAKVEGSGLPVTCGTCHRGHVGPEPFTVQPAEGQLPVQAPQNIEAR